MMYGHVSVFSINVASRRNLHPVRSQTEPRGRDLFHVHKLGGVQQGPADGRKTVFASELTDGGKFCGTRRTTEGQWIGTCQLPIERFFRGEVFVSGRLKLDALGKF